MKIHNVKTNNFVMYLYDFSSHVISPLKLRVRRRVRERPRHKLHGPSSRLSNQRPTDLGSAVE